MSGVYGYGLDRGLRRLSRPLEGSFLCYCFYVLEDFVRRGTGPLWCVLDRSRLS